MERTLDDWIESYLSYTEESEPPKMFREWCAVSVIAAALQRKCWLEWGTVRFFPNLYVVLTAPAGRARKGTAMAPARKFVEGLGIPMAAEAVTREALVRTLCESKAVSTDDEGIIVHSSLTVFSPELTVFLGYNNTQLMSDLTDWFDCADKWVYRTKNSGTDDITGVFINLLGATTPDLIRSTLPLDAIGGGLTSRMIFVYEEKKGKIVPFPFMSPETKALETKLIGDIEAIHMLQGRFKCTQGFMNRWGDWYISQDGRNPFSVNVPPNTFDGYIERRPTQILKLSMIMNASRSANMTLDKMDLDRAIDLLERTEKKMPYTFGGIGTAMNAFLTFRIQELIRAVPEGLTQKDILNQMLYEGSGQEINDSLTVLMQSGRIALKKGENGMLYVYSGD